MNRALSLLFLFISAIGVAQRLPDNQGWLSLTLKKDITKKVGIAASLNQRSNNNFSALSSIFTELELSYSPTKHISTSLAWRCSADEHRFITNRIDWNNSIEKELGDFTLSYRLRLQASYMPEKFWEYRIRNKFDLDYKINKHWHVSADVEPFYTIQYNYQNWDALRYGVGLDYRISKRKRLSIYIKRQDELNTANPESRHIFGVGYKYELK